MPVNATSYGPYDAGAGANITENFWRLMARWFAQAAVAGRYLNELNPFGDSTGLQVKVDSGAAINRGAYGEWTSTPNILPIAAVGGIPGGQSRIDRIIQRNDFVNNLMQLDVLTGTASATPSPPALTQSSSMYEMLIGEIGNTANGASAAITNATTTITAGMVLDGRWKMTESGILYHERILGAAASSILLPAAGTIPQSGRTLVLDWVVPISSIAAVASILLQFNGDNTATNYTFEDLSALAAAVAGALSTTQVGIRLGIAPGTSSGAGSITSGRTEIPWYTSAQIKQAHSHSFRADASATGIQIEGGQWSGTAAITSLILSLAAANLSANTSAVLKVEP